MKLSTDRILTTHVGSLPRPEELVKILRQEDTGNPADQVTLESMISETVSNIVDEQIKAGIDVICDGEVSKMSYHVYAKHRLSGLSNTEGTGVPGRGLPKDIQDFPDMMPEPLGGGGTELLQSAICDGPVTYSNYYPLNRDIANLKEAIEKFKPVDTFMNSVSPGCLVNYIPNKH